MLIKSDRIYMEDGLKAGLLRVEDGKLIELLPETDSAEVDYDYSGLRVIPGIVDTHNHGAMGYSLMTLSLTAEEQVRGYLKAVASHGVTSVFPTADGEFIATCSRIAREPVCGARIMGIHSEGPFLNRVGENGVYTEPPKVDMRVVQQIWEDSGGLLKLMAIAPELPGSQEAVDFLRGKGVHMAFAHSNMDYADAMSAMDRGISVATHTANVMSGIHHRHMGGLGACLLHPDVQCEVICDGMHVAPEMLKLMFRIKGLDQWMMISDMTEAAGAPVGEYNFFGMLVKIDEEGFCKSDTGRLMGSTQPVVHGIKVLVEKVGLPIEQVLRMAALNAACYYGFGEQKGSLLPGKDADFAVIDEDYKVVATFVEGQKVYDRAEGAELFNQDYLNRFRI